MPYINQKLTDDHNSDQNECPEVPLVAVLFYIIISHKKTSYQISVFSDTTMSAPIVSVPGV